jgi:hypothetical protein
LFGGATQGFYSETVRARNDAQLAHSTSSQRKTHKPHPKLALRRVGPCKIVQLLSDIIFNFLLMIVPYRFAQVLTDIVVVLQHPVSGHNVWDDTRESVKATREDEPVHLHTFEVDVPVCPGQPMLYIYRRLSYILATLPCRRVSGDFLNSNARPACTHRLVSFRATQTIRQNTRALSRY